MKLKVADFAGEEDILKKSVVVLPMQMYGIQNGFSNAAFDPGWRCVDAIIKLS